MSNSLFEIYPYRNKQGTWKFDDEATGLIAEPFVGETNTLIDKMVEEAGMTILEASTGVKVMFGHTPFPDYQVELILRESEPLGSTYKDAKFSLTPWLCPAFFKYFPVAPEKFYVRVEEVKSNSLESFKDQFDKRLSETSDEELRAMGFEFDPDPTNVESKAESFFKKLFNKIF